MRLSLSLNGRVSLLTFALLPVLLWLGNWQLQRAEEKRVIAANRAERQEQKPVVIGELRNTDDLGFTPVELRGRFDASRQFLLDNRVHEGRFGYEVITPFRSEEEGQWVLVNRGWVAGNPDRSQLPDVPSAEHVSRTVGSVYVPPGDPFLLAEQDFKRADWPQVIQAVEVEKMARLLDRDLFPHVIRLREDAPGALRVNWQAINVQPGKHTAYAVQWFAMALALIVWFALANTNLGQVLKALSRRPSPDRDSS